MTERRRVSGVWRGARHRPPGPGTAGRESRESWGIGSSCAKADRRRPASRSRLDSQSIPGIHDGFFRPLARYALALTLGTLAACAGEEPPERTAPPTQSERLLVTAGELQAGNEVHRTTHNPLEEDAAARAQGRQLFIWFNCAGCHGPNGGGGMGPPLRDAAWIYGNAPADIFQSIAQGRPNGMPAFGGKIPDEEIWRIELYVRSLGGADTTIRAGASSGTSPTEAQRRTGASGG